jgi:hypothetical protein
MIEPACREVPVTSAMMDEQGTIDDREVRRQITGLLGALVNASSP